MSEQEPPPEDGPPDDVPVGRTPPQDLDAERALLAAMLNSETAVAEAFDVIGSGDLYAHAHETVYDAIVALYGAGQPADAISVNAYLDQHNLLRSIGGAAYLMNLATNVHGIAANVRRYAEIVVEKARLRRLIEVSGRNLQMGYVADLSADEAWDAAEANMAGANQRDQRNDYALLGESVEPAIDEIQALASGDVDRMHAVPTGYMDLDDLLGGGLAPGQMIVVAARPGMGKSVMGLDLLRHAAIVHNQCGVLFSLEMSREEVVTRAIAAEARVSLSKLRDGHLAEHDWAHVAGVVNRLKSAPLFIDDSPTLNMVEIRAKARRLKQRHGLRLIVIDYLQLMTSGKRIESRQLEVSEFSRQIKLLAKELGVPVVALSQLNRGPEQRTSKRPVLSDLRESGSIEQDADIVIMLNRDDMHDPESPRVGEADFIVAKHRNGATRDVVVAFQGHYSRFVDMHQEA